MNDLLDKIIYQEQVRSLIDYVNSMSELEIKILVGITALLILFLVARKLGSGAFWAVALIFLLFYLLYEVDIFGYYESQEAEKGRRMEQIEQELEKF